MSSTWYDDMASAIKERDKCLSAVTRWQAKLKQAEDLMAALAAKALNTSHGELAAGAIGYSVDPATSDPGAEFLANEQEVQQ